MFHSTIPCLHDMSATSIAYRLWTCQDIYKNWDEDNHWQLLESKVSSDVKSLPLPELVKSHLLSIVKPSGRHFFGLLSVWLAKMATSEKWLTKGLLCDCLTLYPVGIINQRKTAEKLLRSKTLDNVIAFRLACANFLEREVLRLWPSVYRHILNKIVLEHQKLQIPPSNEDIIRNFDPRTAYPYRRYRYGYVQETREVLFWIGNCLAKVRGTSLCAVPHYSEGLWDSGALHWAGNSGDISFFEYVINSSPPRVAFQHDSQIINHCLISNNFLISFFYHFSRLKTFRKEELFRKYPIKCTLYFLQWPLSSLFLDHLNHHQEIFNVLFQLNLLDFLLVTILEILHNKSYMGQNCCDKDGNNPPELKVSDVYNVDHMEQIWVALWKLCPDETKSRFMDSFVFTNNLNRFLEEASYGMNFDASTLIKDIRELFRVHSEAILKFLQVENLADALNTMISNYMPERKLDFPLLQLHQLSNKPNYEILRNASFPFHPNFKYMQIVAGLQLPVPLSWGFKTVIHSKTKFELPEIKNAVSPKFINYIQEFLFCNERNIFSFHEN